MIKTPVKIKHVLPHWTSPISITPNYGPSLSISFIVDMKKITITTSSSHMTNNERKGNYSNNSNSSTKFSNHNNNTNNNSSNNMRSYQTSLNTTVFFISSLCTVSCCTNTMAWLLTSSRDRSGSLWSSLFMPRKQIRGKGEQGRDRAEQRSTMRVFMLKYQCHCQSTNAMACLLPSSLDHLGIPVKAASYQWMPLALNTNSSRINDHDWSTCGTLLYAGLQLQRVYGVHLSEDLWRHHAHSEILML